VLTAPHLEEEAVGWEEEEAEEAEGWEEEAATGSQSHLPSAGVLTGRAECRVWQRSLPRYAACFQPNYWKVGCNKHISSFSNIKEDF
jgi:hypothetical protein